MPKTSSIRSVVSIEHRLVTDTDRQTRGFKMHVLAIVNITTSPGAAVHGVTVILAP